MVDVTKALTLILLFPVCEDNELEDRRSKRSKSCRLDQQRGSGLSSSKKAWLLRMIWASDHIPEDYEEFDLTDDDQILKAFEAFMQCEPHSAWEMIKLDRWYD